MSSKQPIPASISTQHIERLASAVDENRTEASVDALVGRNIDSRYQVICCLGEGGMGAVYEVEHLLLKKRFAMKVIRQDLAAQQQFVVRFQQEALSTSRLAHPNCIGVTDYGHAQSGELYLVMEYLQGRTLTSLMGQPQPVEVAVDIVIQMLRGLEHAHAAGVIHRDMKPDNVMLLDAPGGGWIVKVLDFGIATLARSDIADVDEEGIICGTPSYMAPEQAAGLSVDGRSDIYAVGVILWELLTARELFRSDDIRALIKTKRSIDPPFLDQIAPGVFSDDLLGVVEMMLARLPTKRFNTASDLITALERISNLPGCGIKTEAPTSLGRLLARLTRPHQDWYDCVGEKERPSWALRAKLLVTSWHGFIVFATIAAVFIASFSVTVAGLRLRTKAQQGPKIVSKAVEPEDTIDDATRQQLRDARVLLDKRACREADLELKNLLTMQPTLAQAHLLLGAARICRGLVNAGLASYRRSLQLEPQYAQDSRIREDLLELFSRKRAKPAVIDLAADALGEAALVPLLAATTHANYRVRHRAIDWVTRFKKKDRIDWVTVHHLDLDQLRSCRARREIVTKLAELNDPRAMSVLKDARDKKIRRYFSTRYKHGCLRKQIKLAIAHLNKRLQAGHPPTP